jgi:hypothetical protein
MEYNRLKVIRDEMLKHKYVDKSSLNKENEQMKWVLHLREIKG